MFELGLGDLLNMSGTHSFNNYGYSNGLGQLNQQNQYHQMMQSTNTAKWMFNGKVCDVRQMANEIWKTDCPEKTHFILKYE